MKPEEAEAVVGVAVAPNAVDISPAGDGKLWKEVIVPGVGDDLGSKVGMEVKVHYKGSLVDGTVFDQNQEGQSPFSFTLGEGKVIQGWDLGVKDMKKGEKVKLTIHPDLAYKNADQGAIPANSTLIFEVTMVDYLPEDLTKNKTGQILRYNVKEGGSKFLTPNHGSNVEVVLRGEYKKNVVYPEKTVAFRLGQGFEHGIPYGVEKALYKFRADEESVLVIKGLKYLPKDLVQAHNIKAEDEVHFHVVMKAFENVKEPWQLDGVEKLQASRELKETGNKYFGQGNYRVAFKNYKLIVDHLQAEALLTGDDEEERKKLLLAAYLNMAICNIKLNKPTIAIRNCDSALDLDANNTKALFRRGLAQVAVNLPEQAKLDFQKVLDSEPTNSAASQQLALAEKKIKENLRTEKQMYTKMFSGTSTKSTNSESTLPNGLENVNEWNGSGDKS